MAGVGRRTLYRKSVTDEYLNSTPEPGENEEISLVQAPRGSNIIEIMLASGEQALAILPTKFRKLIWVKRGDYLITSTSVGDFETSAGEAGKVRHRVEHILNKDQIKHLKKQGLWPDAPAFRTAVVGKDPRDNWGQVIAKNPANSNKSNDDANNIQPEESNTEAGELRGKAGCAGDSGLEGGKANEPMAAGTGGVDSSYGSGGDRRDGGQGVVVDEEEEEEEEDDVSDLYVNNNRLAMMQLRTDHDDDDDDDEQDSDSEDETD